MENTYLVVDIGGTAFKYAVMDQKLQIYLRGERKAEYGGIDAFLLALSEIWSEFGQSVSGMALSMPGVIDSGTGYCYTGGSFDSFIHGIPLAKMLGEKLGIPVAVENDGKCAALAEAWCGSLKDCKDGIVLLLGTCIAGALIKDGKVHKGKHFSAGEFSYVLLGDAWEDIHSLWGYQNGNEKLRNMVGQSLEVGSDELNGKKIFELANRGNRSVIEQLKIFLRTLAKQIYNLQCIYDPEKIAVGGGISKQPLLLEMLKEQIDYVYRMSVIKMVKPEVVVCEFYNDANLIGALKNYLDLKEMA